MQVLPFCDSGCFLGSLMTIRPDAWFWYSTCTGGARHWGRGRVITSKLRPNRGAHASWANETGQESAEAC